MPAAWRVRAIRSKHGLAVTKVGDLSEHEMPLLAISPMPLSQS